jgi:hypothetical protein
MKRFAFVTGIFFMTSIVLTSCSVIDRIINGVTYEDENFSLKIPLKWDKVSGQKYSYAKALMFDARIIKTSIPAEKEIIFIDQSKDFEYEPTGIIITRMDIPSEYHDYDLETLLEKLQNFTLKGWEKTTLGSKSVETILWHVYNEITVGIAFFHNGKLYTILSFAEIENAKVLGPIVKSIKLK